MIRRPPRSTPLSLHDALPISARDRALEILESLIHHNLGNIFASVFWEKTNLRQLAPEGSKHAAQNAGAFAAALLRIRKRKITNPNRSKPVMEKVNDPAETDSRSTRQRTGQRPQKPNNQPRKRVLEPMAHLEER